MPNIFHNIPVAPAALASQKDLDAAVVAATPKQVKFAGLIVNIPFGKRGSTQTRSTAKGYGAKWDGKEWTLPASKYQPGLEALEWFRTNGLIIGIKTRQYVAWVWDGANTTDLALDIPFDERHTAKSLGAKWEPQFSRWYLPAGQITQTRVDALNAAEAIAGYMNKQGQIAPQLANLAPAPAPVTAPAAAPAPRPVQGVQRPCSSANFVSLVARRWNDLATNLALTYGDSADPERLLRGARDADSRARDGGEGEHGGTEGAIGGHDDSCTRTRASGSGRMRVSRTVSSPRVEATRIGRIRADRPRIHVRRRFAARATDR